MTETSTPTHDGNYAVGDTVEWTCTITNTGNITFLQDGSTISCELTEDEYSSLLRSLSPGVSLEYPFSYTITPADAINGSVLATIEFNGTIENGENYETDEEFYIDNIDSQYTLTVNYYTQNLDGTFTKQTASTFTNVYNYGEYYTVTSPSSSGVFLGRTPDQARVTGQITEDTTINVYYTLIPYILTINYIFIDGATAYSPSYQGTYYYEQSYSVTSPTVFGYTPDLAIVSGNMPARDVIYTVIYKSNPTN